jgi:hypothetical protein
METRALASSPAKPRSTASAQEGEDQPPPSFSSSLVKNNSRLIAINHIRKKR